LVGFSQELWEFPGVLVNLLLRSKGFRHQVIIPIIGKQDCVTIGIKNASRIMFRKPLSISKIDISANSEINSIKNASPPPQTAINRNK